MFWKSQRIALVLALCLCGPARAQRLELTFGRVTLPGGAYGNYVTSIAQDDRGFVWIGTWGGLHRYDGYDVRTFVHVNDDTTSLSNTWVESLYVDDAGTLWIGTFGGGLNRFDPATERFRRYVHEPSDPASLSNDIVTVLLEDHTGTFWVGTHGGLDVLDRSTGVFSHFRHDSSDPSSLSDDQVRALYEDPAGTLWVGTGSPSDPPYDQAGLNRFDRETESFTAYFHNPEDRNSLVDSQVRAILEDSAGRFWVGTWGDGLHTMDRETGRFTRYPYDPEDPGQLSRPHLRDDPNRGGVNFIHEDRAGIIWIGAVNGGLNRYDPSTGAVTHFEGDADDPNSLGENRIWTVFESRDGTLWIGTLGGLHRVDASVGQFPHYSPGPTDFDNATRAIVEDRDGSLWLGTSSGLHLLATTGDGYGRYRYAGEVPRALGSVRIHSLLVDRTGRIWIGTWEQGLYRYDRSSGGLTHFDVSDPGFESLAGITIMALHEDGDGLIWIGTGTRGLFRHDPSTGDLTAYTHDPDDPESLGQNSIRCLLEAADGTLWVGSDGGLSSFDRATERFRTYVYQPGDETSLSDNVVTALWEDRAGHLWIGTESGGLNRLDRATGVFTRLTTVDSGLPADGILGIADDNDGDVWISTDRGLTRLDPDTGTFDSFGADYGLPAEPFYAGSVHRGRNGRLFFGGRNGFHTFAPGAIRKENNPLPPQIAITSFSLYGQLVSLGPDSPLDRAITETVEIALSHSQNDVAFGFAALHFRRPAGNQYSYLLEPYQDTWSSTGFSRRASYTNLDPGEYVFRVKAASSDGVWSEDEATVRMVIHPPFWATWWFRVLSISLVVILVGGSYHLRVRQIHEHNRRLEQLVAERTKELENSLQLLTRAQDQLVHADKMASLGQLVAGIAHELKNPLNFVNNFAELSTGLVAELRELVGRESGRTGTNMSASADPIIEDLTQNIRRINEHGMRADGIIKSMLDHSRGQPGERAPTDLNALLRQYVNLAYHGMRARHTGFNAAFESEYDGAVGMVPVVPQELGRVFVNLLNNALDALQNRKGSEADFEPVISIRTWRDGDLVEIRIGDNGPGVPEEIRYKIFEPFFTTKSMGGGTGLGLSLAYEIVTTGHGGTLTLESDTGQGATFVIMLPATREREAMS